MTWQSIFQARERSSQGKLSIEESWKRYEQKIKKFNEDFWSYY